MKRKAEDTAKRYHELRKLIASRTGLTDDSPRLDYLAMLSLQVDHVRLKLINGDDEVSSSELAMLQSVIEQVSPEPVHGVSILVSRQLQAFASFATGSTSSTSMWAIRRRPIRRRRVYCRRRRLCLRESIMLDPAPGERSVHHGAPRSVGNALW
jgi:hypothetical protein